MLSRSFHLRGLCAKAFDESIVKLIVCPVSKSPLEVVYDETSGEKKAVKLKSPEGREYPIKDGIPHLLTQS